MAIIINDNLAVNVGKPIDSKYLNITTPWTSLSAVWAGIPISYRYIGLTVNINGAEYWFKNSTADVDLILKSLGGTLSGATNGLHISGSNVVLGGIFTGATLDNTIGGGILKYAVSPTFTDPSQIIDKKYADAVSVGVHPKLAVKVATTGNTSPFPPTGLTITIDGINTFVNGDRILFKDQTDKTKNGIYSASTGTWGRTNDFDFTPSGETVQGDLIPVITGATNRNTLWVMVEPKDYTGNTQSVVFTIFSSPSFTQGNSIIITGSTISVDITTGTLATALNSKLNTSIFSSYTGLTQPILNAAITGATNGLNKTGRNVALGGILINDTTIQTATSILGIGNSGESIKIDPSAIVIGDSGMTNNFIFTSPANTDIDSGSGNLNLISGNICVCGTNMKYCVHPTFTGDTQIVDKKYVDDQASGSTTYQCSSPSTITVGGLSAGSPLTGCGLDKILEKILVPYIAPSFSSFNMAGGTAVPTTIEVGCVISGSKCFSFGFNNAGNVCANTLSIRDMNAGGNIATTCPITSPQSATIATCAFTICGQVQGWCGCATNTCSTLFGSGSYSVTGLLPYYYGKCTCPGPAGVGRPVASGAMVTGGTCVLAGSASPVFINFNSSANDYIWFAIPATVVDKISWCVTALDNGAIGGGVSAGCNLFPTPNTVNVSAVNGCWSNCPYKVYVSNYQVSQLTADRIA